MCYILSWIEGDLDVKNIKDDFFEIRIPIGLLNNICMNCNGYEKLCVKCINDFISL